MVPQLSVQVIFPVWPSPTISPLITLLPLGKGRILIEEVLSNYSTTSPPIMINIIIMMIITIMKIPSEMEVAPRYWLLTLLTRRRRNKYISVKL